MAAGDPITDLSDLINLTTGGASGAPEQINFFCRNRLGGAATTAPVAGQLVSLWKYDSSPCAATTTPTTAAVCTNATDGALKQTTSAASTKKRLISVIATNLGSSVPGQGSFILYDRLVHHGGHSGTTTTAQTTNLPTAALTRRTSGVGVEAWLEVYTAVGTTQTTVTLSYTDEAGNSGNTTPTAFFGGTGLCEVNRMIQIPLAVGDRGVRAVANTDLTASTGTAGNYGVTLVYPLAVIPATREGTVGIWSGMTMAGSPLDLGATSDACLAFAWMANNTAEINIFGTAFFLEK